MTKLQKIFYYLIVSTFIGGGLINILIYLAGNKDIYLKEGSVLILIGVGIYFSKNASRVAAISFLISKSILLFSIVIFLIAVYIYNTYISFYYPYTFEDNTIEYDYWYVLFGLLLILVLISSARVLLNNKVIDENNFEVKSKKEDFTYIIIGILLFIAPPVSELIKIYKVVSTTFEKNSEIIIKQPEDHAIENTKVDFEITITDIEFILTNKNNNNNLRFNFNQITDLLENVPEKAEKVSIKSQINADYDQVIRIMDAMGSIGIKNFNLSSESSTIER